MKKVFIIMLLCFSVNSILYCQGNLYYEFNVRNQHGSVSNLKLEFLNGLTGETIIRTTNSSGYADVTLPTGVWALNLPKMPKYEEFTVRDGYMGSGSMSVYYNPEETQREQKFIQKRASITFDTILAANQNVNEVPQGYSKFIIQVIDDNRRVVEDLPVNIVSLIGSKIYSSSTNSSGMAAFVLPLGESYGIDVAETKTYAFTRKLVKQGTIRMRITYEPAKIFEIVRKDTVIQQSNNIFKPYNTHSYLNLQVLGSEGLPAKNENVYLNQIIGSKIYKGKTDDEGYVKFLLPKGDKYMIHFDYKLDVDVIDLRKKKGLITYNGRVTYIPDPRLLNPEGFIPTSEELFVEEFDNFIEKQLPSPTDKAVEVHLNWGNAKINEKSREAILEIGIAVNETEEYKNASPPANLSFIIDRSGSMAGYGRIEALKSGLVEYIEEVRPQDQISVISFSDEPFIELPLSNITHNQDIKEKIESIEPSGGTNIYKALLLGYSKLIKQKNEESTKHIVLLTDGYGETETKTIVDTSKYYNKKGIGLSAIGVGLDYNYALLTLLSKQGGGFLAHSGTSKELAQEFKNELNKLIYPVAKDIQIEIMYNNQVVYKHLFGADVNTNENGRASINLDKLYAGQNNIAIAHFKLNEANKGIENSPVKIKISYYDLIKKQKVSYEKDALLEWEPYTGKNEMIVDAHLKKLYSIAIINQSMKVMAEAFERKDIPKAIQSLQRTSAQIHQLFPEALDADVERLAAKLAMYLRALEYYAKNNGIKA